MCASRRLPLTGSKKMPSQGASFTQEWLAPEFRNSGRNCHKTGQFCSISGVKSPDADFFQFQVDL
tara:strand:- start:30137 stop:30331 length:195 start_codon:yes stop_codon:yes gene_type:complete